MLDFLKRAKASTASSDIRAALAEADREVISSKADAEALEAGREVVLLNGTDADLDRLDGRIASAWRSNERAHAAVRELQKRLSDAEARETNATRRARYEQAKEAAESAHRSILEDYPRIAGQLLDLLAKVAQAQMLVHEVNAALPVGAAPLADPEEAARGIPGEPKKMIRETEMAVWFYLTRDGGNERVDSALLDKIKSKDGLTGTVEDVRGGVRRCEKRRVIKTTYDQGKPAALPEPLSLTIRLPALRVGEQSIWSGAGKPLVVSGRLGMGAADVLAEIEKRKAAPQDRADPRPDYGTCSHTRIERIQPTGAAA